MNYTNIYNQIINNAKNRHNDKIQYYEKHHIIPKCLGGTDETNNLVQLTLREHFICHKLLVKIYPNNSSLIYALWIMCITTLDAKNRFDTNDTTCKLDTNLPINIRLNHFLSEQEKHINITSKDYEYCRMLYYSAAHNKKRTTEQRKNISEATKKAMQRPDRIEKRRKGVLGSKHYYNILTGEAFKWFPGDPDIDLSIYKWGRKSVSTKSITKFKENQEKYKKIFYFNENLKSSTCFVENEIKYIPETWVKGRKYGGYDKMKNYIIPLCRNVHYNLVLQNKNIDDIFYHINSLGKKEISLGLLLIIEQEITKAINNNINYNDNKLILLLSQMIINNHDLILLKNSEIYY